MVHADEAREGGDRPLDIEQPAALLAYLRDHGQIGMDETPTITVLAGGVSNRTVLLERPGGESWVLKQALARLRVEVDWFSDPARIEREALAMRQLADLAPPETITPLIFVDPAVQLLAMVAVPQPHANWKTLLLRGDLVYDHVAQFGTLLGAIHRRASERGAAIADAFADRTFFETLRLEPYYRYTATQAPEAAAFYDALVAETWATRVTLVHGDYSPKNVLVFRDRLRLLDHEVVHWGDPTFDLGFALTHLLSKAHYLPLHRTAFVRATGWFWENYRRALGAVPWLSGLEQRAVRQTLGCLLARVAGRSPLEYLDADARARQRAVVLSLLDQPPATIAGLAAAFSERITNADDSSPDGA